MKDESIEHLLEVMSGTNSAGKILEEMRRADEHRMFDALRVASMATDTTAMAAATNVIPEALLRTTGSYEAIDQLIGNMMPDLPLSAQSLMIEDIKMNFAAMENFKAESLAHEKLSSTFAAQLMAIEDGYDHFLHNISQPGISAAEAAVGLDIVTRAIGSVADGFENYLGMTQSAGYLIDVEIVTPTIFDQVIQDITESRQTEDDGEITDARLAILEAAPSASVTSLAQDTFALRQHINEVSEIKYGKPVFKATSKTERAIAVLPLTVSSNSQEFFQFTEMMFFLHYESSGDFKRLNDIDPEFPIVMDRIKHFRLYHDHDIQHGSDTEIKKKALNVGKHFKGLIGKSYPTTPNDWAVAQIQLMSDIISYLEHICDQLLDNSCT